MTGAKREPGPGELEMEVDVVEAAAPPAGTPPRFRELVALALKTTDERALQDAEEAYRGTYASAHDFIVQRLTNLLPAELRWLPACCDPDRLRQGYERGALLIWEIKLADGRSLVFESERIDLPRTVGRAP